MPSFNLTFQRKAADDLSHQIPEAVGVEGKQEMVTTTGDGLVLPLNFSLLNTHAYGKLPDAKLPH